ncbi:MAG TPA: TonB family protein [Terriglobia bacterium]
MEFLKITPELDSEPRDGGSNGQLGLADWLEPGPLKTNRSDDINLLIELEPESTRWRLRTMFLVSILAHLVLLALLYSASGFIRRQQEIMALEAQSRRPEPMFLYLPPELIKKPKPKTDILSDQDRIAQGKAPVVKPEAPPVPYSKGNTPLPQVAGAGKPTPPTPPAPQPPKPSGGGNNAPAPPKQETKDALKLEDVPKPAAAPGHLAMATPEEAIQQSLRAAAQGRASGQIPGIGDQPGQFNNQSSNFSIGGAQILSDTRGVDFGPYLARIVYMVRQNWYALIPESARLGERGRVAWDFDIQKDGSIVGPDLAASSGAEPLDHAAQAAIRASSPFPPLPPEFTGNHLKLRFIFLYNEGYGPQ